jgi:magnesium chelatase subunit I
LGCFNLSLFPFFPVKIIFFPQFFLSSKMKNVNTLAQLKASGYQSKNIKDEIRGNLLQKLQTKEETFPGILGYEDSVIPDVERAILSRHNILFLGLRGQAKTRMARLMTQLLDEYIPIIAGSEVNDDPFNPISKYAKDLLAQQGDETPITWLHRDERYSEKLATPDVSVADLIGDIDPIKAANMRLSFADEQVIHYGIIPRSNRCIFVINELPDLQARIQVALFNILEEGDIQIRGFKLRMLLDVLFVFTANPEDYTNRGSIVTPLKDRIQSQILTHYPRSIETALSITEQEAHILPEQLKSVSMSDLVKRLIEQVAFEARGSEWVDRKSGVSARLTISACENAVSAAERRCIINKETQTQVWISDLAGIIPSITGKIELVYEGEQEGPMQVALNLLNQSVRTLFIQYFPNPEKMKKRRNIGKPSVQQEQKEDDNPYKAVVAWFDKGNAVTLATLVKQFFKHAGEKESALLMEFVLHGLAAFSMISKSVIENRVEFRDLMGSMLNLGGSGGAGGDDEEL